MTRPVIAVLTVIAGLLAGYVARWRDHRPATEVAVTPLPAGAVLFSAPYCARCSALRALIHQIAPGEPLRELSVVDYPDVVRQLDIRSAPTLLIVNQEGAVTERLAGSIDAHELVKALKQRDC